MPFPSVIYVRETADGGDVAITAVEAALSPLVSRAPKHSSYNLRESILKPLLTWTGHSSDMRAARYGFWRESGAWSMDLFACKTAERVLSNSTPPFQNVISLLPLGLSAAWAFVKGLNVSYNAEPVLGIRCTLTLLPLEVELGLVVRQDSTICLRCGFQ